MGRETDDRTILDKFAEDTSKAMEKHLTDFMNRESWDKNNANFVERWAHFVKTHPRSVWKKQVGPLIDAQIMKLIELSRFQAFEDSLPSK